MSYDSIETIKKDLESSLHLQKTAAEMEISISSKRLQKLYVDNSELNKKVNEVNQENLKLNKLVLAKEVEIEKLSNVYNFYLYTFMN